MCTHKWHTKKCDAFRHSRVSLFSTAPQILQWKMSMDVVCYSVWCGAKSVIVAAFGIRLRLNHVRCVFVCISMGIFHMQTNRLQFEKIETKRVFMVVRWLFVMFFLVMRKTEPFLALKCQWKKVFQMEPQPQQRRKRYNVSPATVTSNNMCFFRKAFSPLVKILVLCSVANRSKYSIVESVQLNQ